MSPQPRASGGGSQQGKDQPSRAAPKDAPKDEGRESKPATAVVEEAQAAVEAAADTGASTDERRKLAEQLLEDTKPPKEVEEAAKPEEEPKEGGRQLSAAKQREADQETVASLTKKLQDNPGAGLSAAEAQELSAAMARIAGSQSAPRARRATREKGWREGTFAPYNDNVLGTSVVFVQVDAQKNLWRLLDVFPDATFYADVQEKIKRSRALREAGVTPDNAVLITQRTRNCRLSRPPAGAQTTNGTNAKQSNGKDTPKDAPQGDKSKEDAKAA